MDFCVGTLIAACIGAVLHIHTPLWYLIIGGILAFLPDFDVIWPILRQFLTGRTITGNHHETVMHRPILLVPAATLIAYIVGGPYWALTACLCVLWHYTHDTKGMGGGGIAWLWPYSSDYWSPQGFAKPTPADSEHDAWIEKNWMRLSAMSVRELSIGLVALSIALFIAW